MAPPLEAVRFRLTQRSDATDDACSTTRASLLFLFVVCMVINISLTAAVTEHPVTLGAFAALRTALFLFIGRDLVHESTAGMAGRENLVRRNTASPRWLKIRSDSELCGYCAWLLLCVVATGIASAVTVLVIYLASQSAESLSARRGLALVMALSFVEIAAAVSCGGRRMGIIALSDIGSLIFGVQIEPLESNNISTVRFEDDGRSSTIGGNLGSQENTVIVDAPIDVPRARELVPGGASRPV